MPKIDFPNKIIPNGYVLPSSPIKLVEGMNNNEVVTWIYQELFAIFQSNENFILKEMKKENIYNELIEKNYDIENLFANT